jgi:UDPglucose 6-dehydrogenase
MACRMQRLATRVNLEQDSPCDLRQLKMAVVGAGVLGTATAFAFAKIAKARISVFDVSRIQEEKSNSVLRKELGRKEMDTISFCPTLSEAIQDADYVSVCVPTPAIDLLDQAYDYSIIDQVMEEFNQGIGNETTILVRSTIDPSWLRKKANEFEDRIWYIPAFFREETYLSDTMNSQYMIVGLPNFKLDTIKKAEKLFSQFDCSKAFTTLETAALAKLFVNAFLATKISFFNEVGKAASLLGGDPQELASLVALDSRIGPYGSAVGRPYDGKCLPKDVDAILKLFDLKVISAAKIVNNEMRDLQKILHQRAPIS